MSRELAKVFYRRAYPRSMVAFAYARVWSLSISNWQERTSLVLLFTGSAGWRCNLLLSFRHLRISIRLTRTCEINASKRTQSYYFLSFTCNSSFLREENNPHLSRDSRANFCYQIGAPMKWHPRPECPSRWILYSGIAIHGAPRFHIPPFSGGGDEEKASKRWRGCPMRDNLAPTRCPAHLCLPVSFSPSLSPSFSSYYFPFSRLRPRRGGLPHLLYSLSLHRAISSLLYMVPKTRNLSIVRRDGRFPQTWIWKEIFRVSNKGDWKRMAFHE